MDINPDLLQGFINVLLKTIQIQKRNRNQFRLSF